jgi:hypothetical protein
VGGQALGSRQFSRLDTRQRAHAGLDSGFQISEADRDVPAQPMRAKSQLALSNKLAPKCQNKTRLKRLGVKTPRQNPAVSKHLCQNSLSNTSCVKTLRQNSFLRQNTHKSLLRLFRYDLGLPFQKATPGTRTHHLDFLDHGLFAQSCQFLVQFVSKQFAALHALIFGFNNLSHALLFIGCESRMTTLLRRLC